MLSIVFNLKYLSQNFIKFNIQGVFWNPQDEQISKLTFLFEFGEDLMEILTKNKLYSFFVDTVYI